MKFDGLKGSFDFLNYVVYSRLRSHQVPSALSWRHFEVKNLDNHQKWTLPLNLASSKYPFYNFLLCKMLWQYHLTVGIVCCLSISWDQFGIFCDVILVRILKKKFFWHNCWIPHPRINWPTYICFFHHLKTFTHLFCCIRFLPILGPNLRLLWHHCVPELNILQQINI